LDNSSANQNVLLSDWMQIEQRIALPEGLNWFYLDSHDKTHRSCCGERL